MAEKSPIEQFTQAPAPEREEKVPTLQFEQAIDAAVEYLPELHEEQLAAAASGATFPGAQLAHTRFEEAPSFAEKNPAAHPVQLDAPLES